MITPAKALNGKIITLVRLTFLVIRSSALDIELGTVLALVIAVCLLPGGR